MSKKKRTIQIFATNAASNTTKNVVEFVLQEDASATAQQRMDDYVGQCHQLFRRVGDALNNNNFFRKAFTVGQRAELLAASHVNVVYPDGGEIRYQTKKDLVLA